MKNDFSQGKVWKNIVAQAIPLIVAQFVQLFYNVADRIYIGHIPGSDSLALTGIGLTFPLTTLITAFTFLYATGATPLFSMARGKRDDKRAEQIMGNTFVLLVLTAVVLWIFCESLKKPILYLFGASDVSYIYASEYLRIYLFGIIFSMISVGMNGFINAEGFPRTGMLTTMIGAVLNLLLDPIFIFGFHMGVSGAALATVLSQIVSCVWVLVFLTGKKAIIPLKKQTFHLQPALIKEITALGISGFIMQGTNCLVQIVCNATLKGYGGDVYVGIMTVVNSIREILELPVLGLRSGAQPVLGFNYGAGKYSRVVKAIRFVGISGACYTVTAWLLIILFPHFFLSVFTNDTAMIQAGVAAAQMYFFGFFFMSMQFTGQTVFTSLGYSKYAIFFSILRKAIIVVPLTLLLPRMGLGVHGVFIAEPVSNAIGGLACFLTMYGVVYKKLKKKPDVM